MSLVGAEDVFSSMMEVIQDTHNLKIQSVLQVLHTCKGFFIGLRAIEIALGDIGALDADLPYLAWGHCLVVLVQGCNLNRHHDSCHHMLHVIAHPSRKRTLFGKFPGCKWGLFAAC